MKQPVQDYFDTEMLNKPAFKLNLTGIKSLNEIDFTSPSLKGDYMICCFTDFNSQIIRNLQIEGYKFISTKNTYLLSSISTLEKALKEKQRSDILRFSENSQVGTQLDYSDLMQTIAEKGRYFKDHLISKEKAYNVYSHWINNSLHNGFADEAIYFEENGIMQGLITLKEREGFACIDLIIVNPSLQGKGIGLALLAKFVDVMKERGLSKILVETEAENIEANRFYQRNGFRLENFQLVFHKHGN